MKHLVFSVIAVFAATAFAQAPTAPAKPAAEATKPVAKPAADPSKQASAGTKGKPHKRWNEDARECLEKTSSSEIIKCAEEFY